MDKKVPAFGALLLLAGCVQSYLGPVPVAGQPQGQTLATQDQTAGIENSDRINRFRRLAAMQGIMAPTVEQLSLPPNSVSYMNGPVPVVRVVFDEKAFFDFNSAVPRPESGPLLDLIAENMRRDVPDAALTVLGHTDAVGTDAYNIELSKRRAANVMAALVQRGVNPDLLSEVAIGKAQPIAPNDTADGRARNRRVEFLVSSGLGANLAAVQQRYIDNRFFSTADGRPAPVRRAVVAEVLKMRITDEDRRALLAPDAGRKLASEDDGRAVGNPKAHPLGDEPTGRIITLGGLTLQAPSDAPQGRAVEREAPVRLREIEPVIGKHPDPA